MPPTPACRGRTRTESTGTIRAYTPGDSPNLISWRHSAHRGTLMTRESGRDTRATLIIVSMRPWTKVTATGDSKGMSFERNSYCRPRRLRTASL